MSRLARARQWCLDRGIFLLAVLIAGSSAMYASFDALRALAIACGWSAQVAPALPLTTDVIAIAAGIRYVRLPERARDARALAMRGVVWSGAVSVIGGAVTHVALTDGWSAPHRLFAILVSAVPAVGLGYVIHLVADSPRIEEDERQEEEEQPAAEEQAPPPPPEDPAKQEAPEEEHETQEDPAQGQLIQLPQQPAQPRRRHAAPTGRRRGGITMQARAVEILRERDAAGETLPSSTELGEMVGSSAPARLGQLAYAQYREEKRTA
ncbi:DUF2637 domain-containing protein [Streptomyces sp. GZWMJZ-114]|uniref:DUF2637 domain-containing protein n=1 Tax=Streptomyces sp. GZWMJZ-114 TaxID=2494734 RepID=UPI001011A881|nr:DUF2637 domain-containing protein [Streptomyces sp. GZWMJZ-114]